MCFSNKLLLGCLLTVPVLALVPGCGGGGGGTAGPPPPTNPFAGSYKGVFYTTAGPNTGDARFFSLKVQTNGAISSDSDSLNAPAGTIKIDGQLAFTRRERDSTISTVNGQLQLPGSGTLIATNSGGAEFLASLARVTDKKTTFDGNYYGTTRIRSGAGIGTVEVIALSVSAGGAAKAILTNANNTSRQLTGTANLTTGALTASGGAGAGAITITVQLVKTGQAGGAFETATNRGTVALNKSL